MIFPFTKNIFDLLSRRKVHFFEESLKRPEQIQRKLLADWNAKQTYLEKIECFEFTSGSSGPKKKIGYTRSLQKSFSNMFQLWCADILNNAPVALKTGVVYMSISPRVHDHGGLNDDSDYVSPILRPFLKKFLAVDPCLQRVNTGEEFYLSVARALLKRKDLEVVSIWSPSYFLSLMDFIEKNQDALGFNGNFNKHWPNLKIISAWDSGESKFSSAILKQRFPDVWFQAKGLLATEGPMTLPWIKARGQLPLLTETYFEFMDSKGDRMLVHQLSEGEEYEILPQFPNLQSPYKIGDKVVCSGFYHKTPLLEFIGRESDFSDLVGEKLSGPVVRELLKDLFCDFVVIPEPTSNDSKARYTFIIDQKKLKKMIPSSEIDLKLKTIHHYQLARELQQLEACRIIFVTDLKIKIKTIQSDLGIFEGDQKESTFIIRNEIKKELYKWALAISSKE
jgi:hypothetical protein